MHNKTKLSRHKKTAPRFSQERFVFIRLSSYPPGSSSNASCTLSLTRYLYVWSLGTSIKLKFKDLTPNFFYLGQDVSQTYCTRKTKQFNKTAIIRSIDNRGVMCEIKGMRPLYCETQPYLCEDSCNESYLHLFWGGFKNHCLHSKLV